jgi:uncharacterized DUF497 family protein
MPQLGFEWDPVKARRNFFKHGISFENARTVFFDPLALTVRDEPRTASSEERFRTVGRSDDGKILVVASCERGDTIRIISAREATKHEKKSYEEGT